MHTVQFVIMDVNLYIVKSPVNFNRHNNSPMRLKLLQKIRKGTKIGQKLVDDLESLFFSTASIGKNVLLQSTCNIFNFFFFGNSVGS